MFAASAPRATGAKPWTLQSTGLLGAAAPQSWCKAPTGVSRLPGLCGLLAASAARAGRPARAGPEIGSTRARRSIEELEHLAEELRTLRTKLLKELPDPAQEKPEEQVELERSRFQELEEEYSNLRQRAQENEFGDPGETWSVPQHECSHPLVSAHAAVTRELFEAELAVLSWQTNTTASPETCARLLLESCCVHLRLMEVSEAYSCLKAGIELGLSPNNEILRNLLDNCLMCECLKTSPSMAASNLDPDALLMLRSFGERLSSLGYTQEAVLQLAGAESLVQFSEQDSFPKLAEAEEDELVDAVSLFLVKGAQLPLERFTAIAGNAAELLLRLQAITVVQDGYQLLSCDEAVTALSDAAVRARCRCFSNIRIWPLPDLLVATDAQDWPYKDFEPVMYLSDDSLALLEVAPEASGLNVLDMCCGGGVQGLAALRRGARAVTFVDVNQRALHFVHFNLALNGMDEALCHFYLGSVFTALPAAEEKFELILANPPFLPNPDNIASQAVAAYGNGGASGEEVLREIVAGCPAWLKPRGRLWLVTYAPNVEEMPDRLQLYLGDVKAKIAVAGGALKEAADFTPAASTVELICYQEALAKEGIRTLAHALAVLELAEPESETSARLLCVKENLYEDIGFLRSLSSLLTSGKNGCSRRS